MIIGAMAISTMVASAATVEELALTPTNEVTPANVESVIDACIATTNYNRAISLSCNKKITGEALATKFIAAKTSLSSWSKLLMSLRDNANQTNMLARASFIEAINFSALERNNDLNAAQQIVIFPTVGQFLVSADALPLLKKIYAENKVLAVSIAAYCFHHTRFKENVELQNWTANAYEEAKNLEIKSMLELAGFIHYAFYSAKDYNQIQVFAANKNLINLHSMWLYPKSAKPELQLLNKNCLEYLKTLEVSKRTGDMLFTYSRVIDKHAGNKKATEGIFAYMYNSSSKLNVAKYLKDTDKIIETLITCDDSLKATEIDSIIPVLNALDPEYKPAEVVKALRAVNQRYTLKLYDDRDTWEPILSKIRAMIDCR